MFVNLVIQTFDLALLLFEVDRFLDFFFKLMFDYEESIDFINIY